VTRAALNRVTLSRSATLREVLESVDRSGLAVALLIERDGSFAGLLTDGDVRRAILKGADLDTAAVGFATAQPHTVQAGSGRAHVLDLMRALRISAVPEVDADGRVVGLHTLSDVVGVAPLRNPAVIMAGGRGTRLGTLTRSTPKPLVEVAGRSILEWNVLNLVGGGVRDVHVSVNHLAEQIEEHLGDGGRLGCTVTYLREQADHPLGTAGSLSLLRDVRPGLDVPVIVMNGDLMVQFEPQSLLATHEARRAAVTVATQPYQHEVPYGVVDTTAGLVTTVREKPTLSLTVNAGVYVVSPEALALVPTQTPCTMPELITQCIERGLSVAAWPLASDWIDVGTPADLARAKGHA
jgi:dTDP-glucose pyrophosphorylase